VSLLHRLARAILRHRAWVLVAWIALIASASVFAARLPGVLRGGADAIPGSESEDVTSVIRANFGAGTLYPSLVVLRSGRARTSDVEFARAALGVSAALTSSGHVRSVQSYWNTGTQELLGHDGHSALLVVTPRIETYIEAEILIDSLRTAIAGAALPEGYSTALTGSTATLYDLDHHASVDLLEAERVGLPLAMLVLLLVFRSPLAAILPVVLAMASVTVSFAGLFALSRMVPVSVFAQNVVSMIGLGVGVDYVMFLVGRYRQELASGRVAGEAIVEAVHAAGESVVFSGATVVVGFLALFLVRAPFLHAIALGGVAVVVTAVAAALTLLPVLLSWLGPALAWPRRAPRPDARAGASLWGRWAHAVMRRPWWALAFGVAALAVFVVPVTRLQRWNIGARNLPVETEARLGYDRLVAEFDRGWMGPIVLLVEPRKGGSVWSPESRRAIAAAGERLARDPRIAKVQGFPALLSALDERGLKGAEPEALPLDLSAIAREVVSPDGDVALIAALPAADPESPDAMKLLRSLRAERWEELSAAGLRLRIGGTTAVMADFDAELFGSLPRVIALVLLLTFLVMLVLFRSVLIPLKATVLNLLSVLAAYGFLVYVFQDGIGARWIHLDPPGGLNSFIVLMLFTILFGLSMDYEVFLLGRVREAYRETGDTGRAVAIGLERTAGLITSAALIMISIFASFGFTRLIATREFGLGLAFAVALDATLIRVVLVPALMVLAGDRNWWPGERARARRI
jgi:uncharacterized membrane protein YdfJ with MMPL/SSD domain